MNQNVSDEREYQVRDDRTVVKTTQTEELSPEETVARYNSAVNNAQQIQNGIQNFEQQLEHTLDKYNFEMGVLHALDEDQSQKITELDVENIEELEDSINKQIIEGYYRVLQTNDKKAGAEDRLVRLLNDVEDLYPYARKMADKTGAELDMTPEELENELFIADTDESEEE